MVRTVYLVITIVTLCRVESHSGPDTHPEMKRVGLKVDRMHVMEDLKDQISGGDKAANMNDEEMLFAYFRVHDTNRDGMLDGLEILKALDHTHDGTNDKESVNVEKFSSYVDRYLDDEDLNNDGYIDFPEFMIQQSSMSDVTATAAKAAMDMEARK